MKRRRNRTLPEYVRTKRLASGKTGYFFEVPKLYREAGCTVRSEPLGTDYEAMRTKAGTLYAQLESWRTGGASDLVPSSKPTEGTFDWLSELWRGHRSFKELDKRTKKLHEAGLKLVSGYRLKDGRTLGAVALAQITPEVVDALYDKLVVTEGGRERRTTINHAMKSCRRAWNVGKRLRNQIVPALNPFSAMGLKGSTRETPTATWEHLVAFVRACDADGLASLGTAALVTWEWLQREEHVFGHFEVAHYRPKAHPDKVLVVHPKTDAEAWVPLFGEDGEPLYPELMARLDAIKRDRIGGLMLMRDWPDEKAGVPVPWVTQSGDLTYMRHTVKAMILKAGLPKTLSFTSFRHGGFTESGDAELTDAQIRATSRQRSQKVLPRYVKKTTRQIAEAARKRRATRAGKETI